MKMIEQIFLTLITEITTLLIFNCKCILISLKQIKNQEGTYNNRH